MTRQIRIYEKAEHKASANANTVKYAGNVPTSAKRNKGVVITISGIVAGASELYRKGRMIKREISDSFVSFTEELADKTAREGLFGEDKGKGYCGTDVDFIG